MRQVDLEAIRPAVDRRRTRSVPAVASIAGSLIGALRTVRWVQALPSRRAVLRNAAELRGRTTRQALTIGYCAGVSDGTRLDLEVAIGGRWALRVFGTTAGIVLLNAFHSAIASRVAPAVEASRGDWREAASR
jgi:hypothetical protein